MKRILALTLVLTLALGACAGLSLAEGDENFNSTGYPIANEPVTYTALVRHSSVAARNSCHFLREINVTSSALF